MFTKGKRIKGSLSLRDRGNGKWTLCSNSLPLFDVEKGTSLLTAVRLWLAEVDKINMEV